MIYAQVVAGMQAAEDTGSRSWFRRVLVAVVLATNLALLLSPPAVALLALTGVVR